MSETKKDEPPIKLLLTIIGALILLILFILGWKIAKIQIFGVELVPPSTSTPTPPSNNSNSQASSDFSNTGTNQNPSSFIASSPLLINGTSYSVPTSTNPPFCVSKRQTDYSSSGIEYDLVVPKGWFIVWASSKAYWPGGSYETDGLLQVYGNWQGKVTIYNGGYCAVPVEWEIFATYLEANVSPNAVRPQFTIGKIP